MPDSSSDDGSVPKAEPTRKAPCFGGRHHPEFIRILRRWSSHLLRDYPFLHPQPTEGQSLSFLPWKIYKRCKVNVSWISKFVNVLISSDFRLASRCFKDCWRNENLQKISVPDQLRCWASQDEVLRRSHYPTWPRACARNRISHPSGGSSQWVTASLHLVDVSPSDLF